MDTKNINILGIIGLVGAIILIVGVFLNWLTIKDLDIAYNGWDIFGNKDDAFDEVKYTFVPLVALICGIISLVLMIVPTIMNTEKFEKINNILGLIALILSAVVVICGILFYTQSFTHETILGDVTWKLTDLADIGIGFWLVLVGGIITLVGGLMPILKNKFL